GQDNFHIHQPGARTENADALGGGVAQINNAVVVKRAAIIHAHHHGFAVSHIGYPHIRRNRQGFVGSGHGVHVVNLAIGGAAPVKLGAVPGGFAALLVGAFVFNQVVGFAEHCVGIFIARTGALFVTGHGIWHMGGVHHFGGRAIAYVVKARAAGAAAFVAHGRGASL